MGAEAGTRSREWEVKFTSSSHARRRERVPMRSEKMRNTEFSNLTVRTVRW